MPMTSPTVALGFLGVDVGFEAALVAGELVLNGGLVEVLHPAFLFVDGGAALGQVSKAWASSGTAVCRSRPGA